MENAVKYNKSGGQVSAADREGNQAVFTVGIHGIGIPPDCQNRVFERFYRVDKGRSLSGPLGGTGLDSAIVKHIVALYGGQIKLVLSTVGSGTTVTVYLPLA